MSKIIFSLFLILVTPNVKKDYLPHTLLSLSCGNGNYQVGLSEEGAPYGPNRICAKSGCIYILDRINHRVSIYNYDGNFVSTVDANFYPADLAVDGDGNIYLLENRTKVNYVKVYNKEGEEIKRYNFYKDPSKPAKQIMINPGGEFCLYINRRLFNFVLEEDDLYSLKESKALPSFKPEGDAEFIGSDRKGNLYFVSISAQKEGNDYKYRRNFKKYSAKGKLLAEIEDLPKGYFSYHTGNRDICVDENGDIFQLYTSKEKNIDIIKWCR